MRYFYRFTLLFILCFYNIGGVSYAFLGEETGLNLYNILDEGYSELESKNFEYELSGTDNTIKDKINNLLKLKTGFLGEESDCIEGDLAPSHIEEIAKGDISILYEKIGDKCKDDKNTISIATISLIKEVITDHYNTSLLLASEKSSQMQRIGSIGMYSDGVTENATFDLMDDLEKIDAIIFASKSSYNGSEYENMKDSFDDIINEKKSLLEKNTTDIDVIKESTGEKIAYIPDIGGKEIDPSLVFGYSEYSNNYVCLEENSDNGFDSRFLDELLQNNTKVSDEDGIFENVELSDDTLLTDDSSNDSDLNNDTEIISGNYSSVNDNALWPCSDFFCIMIDFQVYEQQLLGGGDNITIEYLLDRSNKHLRKFANSSLTPSQMTSENFELGFKNLDLAGMFHMGFQIQSKPVPILSIKDEDKEDSNEYKSTTLLEKYYKSYGLDYQRRNDIVVYKGEQNERKSILNSSELNVNSASDKDQEMQTYLNKQSKKADLISTNIYKKGGYETLGDFGNQFIELNNFTVGIRDYSENWLDIVKAMNKIPTQ